MHHLQVKHRSKCAVRELNEKNELLWLLPGQVLGVKDGVDGRAGARLPAFVQHQENPRDGEVTFFK